MSITAMQSRMARAALGWTGREAATHAHVGLNTLSRFESGGEAYLSTAKALRSAYEGAGVQFIGDDGARLLPIIPLSCDDTGSGTPVFATGLRSAVADESSWIPQQPQFG